MVEPTGNVVVSLDLTNALADDALGLVRKVVAAVNQQVQVPADLSGLTTTTRDLVTEVVPTLVQELRTVTQGRQTWLVLEGLEATSLEAIPTIKDLIVATAKQLPVENLRLVLVGCRAEAPPWATSWPWRSSSRQRATTWRYGRCRRAASLTATR